MISEETSKEIRLGAQYIGDGVYLNKRKDFNNWILFTDNGLKIYNVIFLEDYMVDKLFYATQSWEEIKKEDN